MKKAPFRNSHPCFAPFLAERKRHEETCQSLKNRINTLHKAEKAEVANYEQLSKGIKTSGKHSEDILSSLKRIRTQIIDLNEQSDEAARNIRHINLNLSHIRRGVWDSIFHSLRDQVISKVGDNLQRLFIAAKLRNEGHTINVWLEAFGELWGPQPNVQEPSQELIDDTKKELLEKFAGDVPEGF